MILRLQNGLSKTTNILECVLVKLGIILLVIMTINMFISVIFRYIFHNAIFWSDELSLNIFAWITFIGAAIAVKRSEMAAMTMLLDKVPPLVNKILKIIINFFIFLFAIIVFYYSIAWINHPSVQNIISATLRIKMWIVYTIIPSSMLLIAIFSLDNIAKGLVRENVKVVDAQELLTTSELIKEL